MLKGVLGKVFGTRHERERRRIQPIVDEINEHYARLQGVSEEELRAQTAKFRSIIREGTIPVAGYGVLLTMASTMIKRIGPRLI